MEQRTDIYERMGTIETTLKFFSEQFRDGGADRKEIKTLLSTLVTDIHTIALRVEQHVATGNHASGKRTVAGYGVFGAFVGIVVAAAETVRRLLG